MIHVPDETGRRIVGWRDHLIGLFLGLAYVAVLLPTSRDLAMSRDESFYVIAAERYGAWFELLANDTDRALTREAIDAAWTYNHEHPALPKSLFALSHLANEKLELFPSPSMGHRFPGMLMAGLVLYVTYLFGARAHGRREGLFAAASMALLPQPFYHAHLNCFDVPITAMLVLCTYLYHRAIERPRYAPALGLAYGLALATKHNAWILPGVFFVHYLFVVAGEVSSRRRGEGRRVTLVPYWFLAMAAIGPLVFVGSWPWLWHDTAARFGEYVRFHVHHDYYNMAYFGVNYFWPPFPVSFPFVMTVVTVPLTFTVFALLGLALRASRLLPAPLARRWARRSVGADALATDVLVFGSALAPLVVIAMPWTPIFGGSKHWMTGYPFLALFAGITFGKVVDAIAQRVAKRPVRDGRSAPLAITAPAFALFLAPSLVETWQSHPYGLAHYTLPAGGVAGAADLGMNRQFWGYTTGGVARFLAEALPNGGTVWPCDTTFRAIEMMHQDGMLPSNVRPTPSFVDADYVLVHHEHHFAEVDFQAWVAFGSVAPAYVLTHQGVPLVSVYANSRRRALHRKEAALP